MKFGLFYLFSDFGAISQEQLFQEVLEEIEYGEELGFESVWLAEHHFAVYGMLGNPLTLAAAIAQRTDKMRIGTAVVVLPFQHPLRVAEDAAMVDLISGGRLMLGVGRGYQPPEFNGFGVEQDASRAMFLESLEILTKALRGEEFTYDGKFWKILEPTQIYPKPIQKPHPPLYLASISPSSAQIAARMGMSLLRSPQFSNLDTVAETYEKYTAQLKESGYEPSSMDQPLSMQTFVAPSNEEAKEEISNVVWFYHLLSTLLPGAPGKPKPVGYEHYPRDPSDLSTITADDVWERGTCFGSPERVIEIMSRYQQRTSTNHWMIQMRIGGLDHGKVMRSMELFAKYVMPALQEEEVRTAAS